MSWLKAVLTGLWEIAKSWDGLKDALTKIGAYYLGKRQGRLEQANANHEAGDQALERGADALDQYNRGGLRDKASEYHTSE